MVQVSKTRNTMFTIYFFIFIRKNRVTFKNKKNHEKSGTGRHSPAAGAARHMDYGTSPNELDKKKREMKMRRKPEKERGQKTVYSAFWPAERPRGL